MPNGCGQVDGAVSKPLGNADARIELVLSNGVYATGVQSVESRGLHIYIGFEIKCGVGFDVLVVRPVY